MMQGTQKQKESTSITEGARSYKEVITFLDSLKRIDYSKKALDRIKQLDTLFGNISKNIDVILVGGTNGKSSTIHFASKLLKEEGYKVGAKYSSHILNYNEHISVDFQNISNKSLGEIANNVISTAKANKIEATNYEIMLITALIHFKEENVDVAIFEVGVGGKYDAANIFESKISAITRVAQDDTEFLSEDLDKTTIEMLQIAKKDSWLVSAEQSKIRLNKMKDWAEENNIKWSMPVRKLAPLPYIYEQLYGRSASLGERIAQLYTEEVNQKFSPFLRGNLLATQKGQRGRPTLIAKRNAELNPIKTLEKFWKEEFSLLPGRFEILDKEKPSILLDTADNTDAFENLFLGIRLLHYQKPIKDFTMLVGLPAWLKEVETIKLIRYLIKKINGHAIFVPIPGIDHHNPKKLGETAKEAGLRCTTFDSFEKAFESIKNTIDEREGLCLITGHQNLVSEYWKLKGIKKV